MPFKVCESDAIREHSTLASAVFSMPLTVDGEDLPDLTRLATAVAEFGPDSVQRSRLPSAAEVRSAKRAANEAVNEALTSSESYQSWASRYATVHAAIGAVNRNDATEFELILYNLNDVERDDAQIGFRLSDEVNKVVKGMVRRARSTGDREKLEDAARIAIAALDNEVHFDSDPRKAVTTQTLAVELHQAGLYRTASKLVEVSLRRNASLKPETVLSTLGLAGKAIRNRAHMIEYAELAKRALQSGALDVNDERVVRVYDVVLAALGAPTVHSNPELGRFMNERSLVDVSLRLLKAGEVGLAVSDAGMTFDLERNESRMNMLIRGLVTGAAAISCQSLKLITRGDRLYHKKLDRYFSLDTEFPWLGPNGMYRQRLPERAEQLVNTALELANRSLVYGTEAGLEAAVVQAYRIQGSTVNNLLKAIHDTGMEVDSYTGYQMGALIQKALLEPEVKRKLHSRHIRLGLESMIRSDSEVARYEAVRGLARALDSGFGFPREFIQAVYDASGAEYGQVGELIPRELLDEQGEWRDSFLVAGVVGAFDEEGQAALQRLERILFKPERHRLIVEQDFRPRAPRALAGGLGLTPREDRGWMTLGEVSFSGI